MSKYLNVCDIWIKLNVLGTEYKIRWFLWMNIIE